MTALPSHASTTVVPSISSTTDNAAKASRLFTAGQSLLAPLQRGEALEAHHLRSAMVDAFGASDAEGAWVWKDAYEAVEVAQILFLRRFLQAMQSRTSSDSQLLGLLERVASLTPTHTRRSEESQSLQQFSTPLPLAYICAVAADLTSADYVLEPSAGTGMLAIFAELAGARLNINEIGDTRAELLARLFPSAPVSRFNAEHIHDYLPADAQPTVVMMNPPFSASLHVAGTHAEICLKHIRSALLHLAPGGRLVTITGANLVPTAPAFADGFRSLQQIGTVLFTSALDGDVYRKHGTTFETRLTVIDRVPQTDTAPLPSFDPAPNTAALLERVLAHVPARSVGAPCVISVSAPTRALLRESPRRRALRPALKSPEPIAETVEPLSYECVEPASEAQAQMGESIYEPYRVETIRIAGARAHPSTLVQSAAMASVRPPKPTYRPQLPSRVVTEGILSDAQLESVIYAGEAHAHLLAGRWKLNDSYDALSRAQEQDEDAIVFRRGWFLGDGTGAGKGRQIAGILLDNWIKGRRRAVWVSKSDKLIEDAQRDWSALGQEKLQIVPLDRFRQGKPILLDEAILFTTYATLRSAEREGKASRLSQMVDWLGKDFDGVIVFDEAHAMGNAGGVKSNRGGHGPSQQGLAGLRLQHMLPGARIVYVSATGATTVENLAYAQRLGLWGGDDFPFASRTDFVTAMEEGGIATMEVLARDLKALGLYAARSLSYEGVQVDILEHSLTPEQIRIYDAYAGAFQVIHNNLEEALKAANVTGDSGTLNRQAKSAARSAFESNKQRFFNHLITAMKVPSLIRAIEADRLKGHAAVIQLVTTSEALMERRLANIPPAEWQDLSIDVTPREYVLDYLAHGFPTQLYEPYTDENGNLLSRPVMIDGNPVQSREAEACRDRMIEHLAALPPVQSGLDQIIHHFGTDAVAEVTGRSRRIVRRKTPSGFVLAVENRPASANLAESQAFMDDDKPILVFSDAGGTGRSYHADLACRNQRQRVHYLLEAGWKADTAIQGLGRSNRTNQKQPPIFRPIATDVCGEKRFLSTIARRLDSLGAITRGQRQTGGHGMFRAEDNLESSYARAALRQLYDRICRGRVPECSLQRFQDSTGLKLTTAEGAMLDELPPITTFLNRLLALQIELQNDLFIHFEALLSTRIESAIAGGTYEVGLETIRAESLLIAERNVIAVHTASGAETRLYSVTRKDRNRPTTLDAALEQVRSHRGRLLGNSKSGRAAFALPTSSWTLDDGTVEPRIRMHRPMDSMSLPLAALEETNWEDIDQASFSLLWEKEVAAVPDFTTTTFHVVTGLLLPIWKRLPFDNPRVYRFETDDGERVIGRLVPPTYVEAFTQQTSHATTPAEAWASVCAGTPVQISLGCRLARVMVMHAHRIELVGFDADHVERLKAHGLTSEIINWRLRLFVPMIEAGPEIVARLLADPLL